VRILACIACALAFGLAHADELKRAGFLGVRTAPNAKGVAITALVEGGAAEPAGLREGDIITAVNGAGIGSQGEFIAILGKLHAGDKATLAFLRGDEAKSVDVKIAPRPYESAPGVDTRYLSVSVNGQRRRLIVTVPRAPRRHPAVLYVTGIGCFSQESVGIQTTDAKLLYGLTEAGFVTMRVEKSGIGDSEGISCSADGYGLTDEVSGYVAALLTLRGYDFVDPGNVFVMGVSIGGVEAPLIARQAPVKGIVVINTVAKPFLDYLHEVRRRQMVLRRTAYDEIEDRLKQNDRCNTALLAENKSLAALLTDEPDCRDFVTYPAPVIYMRQWTTIVPAKEWKLVDAPVLIVSGDMDFIAMPSDAPYLRDMIESFHPGSTTLVTIPTMTHYMGHADSLGEALEKGASAPFETRVLETVSDWLSTNARAK